MIRKKPNRPLVKHMDDLGFDWWLDWESVIFPNPGTTAGSPPSTSEISAKKNAASWPGNAAEGGKEERQETTASLANAKEISCVCPIAPKVCIPRGFLSVVPGERFPNLQKPDRCHSTFCHEDKSWSSISLSPAQEACACATASRCKANRNWCTLWFWFTKVRNQVHGRVSVITKDDEG